MKKIRKIISVLAVTAIVLMLMALMYAALCMNITEETRSAGANATPRPYIEPLRLDGEPAHIDGAFPYPVAELAAETHALSSQRAYDVRVQGRSCRVIERVYTDAQGVRILLRSATPALYLAAYADCTVSADTYALPGGFTAQYLEGENRICLLLREGETIYVLETHSDREALLRASGALAFA